jgi:hypothetical protein
VEEEDMLRRPGNNSSFTKKIKKVLFSAQNKKANMFHDFLSGGHDTGYHYFDFVEADLRGKRERG